MRKRLEAWALPFSVGAMLLLACGVGLMLLRHRPLPAQAKARVPDAIGLSAVRDGDSLRVEWSRKGGIVRNADHAVLAIDDGKEHSKLELTHQQLLTSGVRYWPESKKVAFRLEVYRNGGKTSDEIEAAGVEPGPAAPHRVSSQATVERLRPSPFERAKPELVQSRRADIEPVSQQDAEAEAAHSADREKETESAAPTEESGWSRAIRRIPLLKRLRKNPQAADSAPVSDTQPHR